jgi:hypothetical protein
MISAHRSATSRISRYLHRLLRPLMASTMRRHVFTGEPDFIQRLIHYSQADQKQLQPTTLFATIQITNAQSIVSHASLVETSTYFLRNQLITNQIQYTSLMSPHPQYIAISTITKLTELYLQHNLFYYQDKIYGFNKSGPNSLLLSDDLLDIYLFAWQEIVFDDERLKTELCGRYWMSSSGYSSMISRFLVHVLDIVIPSFLPGINPNHRCTTFSTHWQTAIQRCNCKHRSVAVYNFSILILRIVKVACIPVSRIHLTTHTIGYSTWLVTPK